MFYVTYKKQRTQQMSIDDLYSTGNLDNRIYEHTVDAIPHTRTIQVPEYKTELPNLEMAFVNITNFMTRSNLDMVDKKEHYYSFQIPKKTGGYREINAPKAELMAAMRTLKNLFERELKVQYHDNAYAYTKQRDVNTAVRRHQKNKSKWFLKVDITKFFNNCNPAFIKEQFKVIHPFSYLYLKDARAYELFIDELCKLCCLDNELPQGTPMSPMLTNLLMIPFDYAITRMLWKNKELYKMDTKVQTYVYTRYADDIIISGRESFKYDIIVSDIKTILEDYPFQLKDEKTRYGSNAGRNWNLGLMYNKDLNITIGHKRKKQIKCGVHNFINRTSRWELDDLRILLGELSYLRNIEPEYFNHLIDMNNGHSVWYQIIEEIRSYNN